MKVADAVRSWLDIEQWVRDWAECLGGKLAEEVDALYDDLRGGNVGAQRAATWRLKRLCRHALANMDTRYPSPNVPPSEWQWGRPGTQEDRQVLDAGQS